MYVVWRYVRAHSGRNWVILKEGAQVYLYNRKDEIIHGLSPNLNCVAPLNRDMSSLKKCEMQKGARVPSASLPVAPLRTHLLIFNDLLARHTTN